MKKRMIRKIIISSSALFALLLIYLMPDKLDIKENLEYVNNDIVFNNIYLLDDNSYLGKTKVVINSTDTVDKVRELIEILISGGQGENKIPNGFKSFLPSETKIKDIFIEEDLVKINFSNDLLDINESLEEKMIESLVYTITSLDDINKIIIYVDGDILTKLPKTNITLPSTLDRTFGINKIYNFTKTDDINQVTIYYLSKKDDNYYYVPVTKYLNDNRDKVKIIIEQLTTNNSYNTNLMSYLNSNTSLLAVLEDSDILELTFNNYIFENIESKNILEEVIYTICLSIKDNYSVDEVIIKSDNEVIKYVLKEIN